MPTPKPRLRYPLKSHPGKAGPKSKLIDPKVCKVNLDEETRLFMIRLGGGGKRHLSAGIRKAREILQQNQIVIKSKQAGE